MHHKEEYVYVTSQCVDCGYFPNSDFEKNALKMDCDFCRQLYEITAFRMKYNIPISKKWREYWLKHIKSEHPEMNVVAWTGINTDNMLQLIEDAFNQT